MLTAITSEASTSTAEECSAQANPPVELSLKAAEEETLGQGEMYSLENSLDDSHLLQVRLPIRREYAATLPPPLPCHAR